MDFFFGGKLLFMASLLGDGLQGRCSHSVRNRSAILSELMKISHEYDDRLEPWWRVVPAGNC